MRAFYHTENTIWFVYAYARPTARAGAVTVTGQGVLELQCGGAGCALPGGGCAQAEDDERVWVLRGVPEAGGVWRVLL